MCSSIFLQTLPSLSRPLKQHRENQLFSSWVHALFDRNSEGIEDHLLRFVEFILLDTGSLYSHLRATTPASLFCFAPALVAYAINAMHARMIDPEGLRSGLSYFQGALLNWTLVGVINGLIAEIMRLGYVNLPSYILRLDHLHAGC
jgi:mediator of RNA polymerase II transcription subunit 5